MQNSSLTHPTGHFRVKKFRKNWDLSYRHIYLGHPLKLKRVWANIVLGDFTGATPSFVFMLRLSASLCKSLTNIFERVSLPSSLPWSVFMSASTSSFFVISLFQREYHLSVKPRGFLLCGSKIERSVSISDALLIWIH